MENQNLGHRDHESSSSSTFQVWNNVGHSRWVPDSKSAPKEKTVRSMAAEAMSSASSMPDTHSESRTQNVPVQNVPFPKGSSEYRSPSSKEGAPPRQRRAGVPQGICISFGRSRKQAFTRLIVPAAPIWRLMKEAESLP